MHLSGCRHICLAIGGEKKTFTIALSAPARLNKDCMPITNTWSYARCEGGNRVEQASWCGNTSSSLRAHFHDEIQITTVLAGVQRFSTPLGPLTACTGETAVIGPTVPHELLGLDEADTICFNLYVRPIVDLSVTRRLHVVTTPRWLQRGEWGDRDGLAAWATEQIASACARPCSQDAVALAAFMTLTDLEIGSVAKLAGMTREGFTRRFCR